MQRAISFLWLSFCLIFMSSCAGGVGALVTITAFGVEAYEEARIHRPDLKLNPISSYLPNLEFSSNQTFDHTNKKASASNPSVDFGFECSKLKDKKKQSKCFDDFSKTLAEREDKSIKTKDVVTPRKKEKLTKLQKVAKTPAPPVNKAKKISSTQNKSISKEKKLITSQTLPASFIQGWANAWEKKDLSTYLSFYSKEFKGSKNHRGAWEASRQRALKKNKNISIELSNIKDNQKDPKKVEVNFIQRYKSDRYTDTGIKELIVEKKGTGWKIIKETWMTTSALAGSSKQVTAKLAGWLNAWEDRDVNTYLSFYSDKFKTQRDNRAKWRNARHSALKANKNISIKVENIQIYQNKNIIELNFIQEFNSDKFSSIGIKELVWKKTGSNWKILKETWMPI